MKLTKYYFLMYQKHVEQAKTARQRQNILYTFLNYYRHLGETPSLIKSGQDYIRTIKMFKTVINKFHLNKPISKLPKKTLAPACKMSVNAIAVWYYTNEDALRIQVINVSHIRKVKVAMQRVTSLFSRIKRRHDLCLGMQISKTKVIVLYVPKNKIVKPHLKKHNHKSVRKHNKRNKR